MTFRPEEIEALRLCAARAWQNRDIIGLPEHDRDQVLLAWQAVGGAEEAEAAARLLAARRETARQQSTFDQILTKGGA